MIGLVFLILGACSAGYLAMSAALHFELPLWSATTIYILTAVFVLLFNIKLLTVSSK